MRNLLRVMVLGGVSLASAAAAAEPAPSSEQLAFFEKHVRPILVDNCYGCHSAAAKEPAGGFLLDSRDGIRKGGKHGAAVVPGEPDKSLLLKAIRHEQDDLKMPKGKDKLADTVIADLTKWVAMGAPDPRDEATKPKTEIDVGKGKNFWSFQKPKKTNPPDVKNTNWPRCDIDRFILADIEAKGLKPVADADARTLLRRVYFDLIGLPPSPDEVEQFAKDYSSKSPEALEKVVDKLLASPQFGERWGRHWLDIARFAESSGRASNFAYPHAWRYRDYVIAAFNADKPYDRFIREQLAGDLLTAKDDNDKAELTIATGFLAIGPKSLDERNPRQFQMDVADEQIDATFQAFQALTVACARCHDHKFDPIPQKDYYAVAGIFRSTETCYGTIRLIQSNHPAPLISLPKGAEVTVALEPLSADRKSSIDKQIQDLKDQSSKLTGTTQDTFLQRLFINNRTSVLQAQLDLYESDGTPKNLAMGVRDSRIPSDANVLTRGEVSQPAERVSRGFPQVLTSKQPRIRSGSGRLELADFIASPDNPLTARVMANRTWLHLIGKGVVATPDNFGANGLPPTDQALLDNLALTFIDNGWSVKKLIRTIVLSRTYQLSSQFNEENFEADPDNTLVWRMPSRRLEAEAIRDTMLQVAGKLDFNALKGSPVAQRGEGNAGRRPGGPSGFGGPGGDVLAGETHRSVYQPIVRDGLPEVFTLFDFPDPSLIIGDRPTTTVPAQALYLLNNPYVIRLSEEMADRVLAAKDDDKARLTEAYLLCYSRPPTDKELKKAQGFLEDYGRTRSRRTTWAVLCQAMFASAEFSRR
jgi:hypothetical protein